MRSVMVRTIRNTRPLRCCAVLAVLGLLAATANVRAQQPVIAAAPLQSSPAAAGEDTKSSALPRTPPVGNIPAGSPDAPSFTDASGKVWKAGDACTLVASNVTMSKSGLMKRDACERWYCSTSGVKDIIEIKPNIAALLKCTWRLEGVHCKCRTADYQP